MYKGDSIGVERNQVPYQLYQYGFGKVGPISGTFAEDGSYSQVLYDGTYKLLIPNAQGPFLWKKTSAGDPDTLTITLHGNQVQDLEVLPYYMIRNPKIVGNGGSVTATCSVEQVITDPAVAQPIERMTLYVNKTQFVSGSDNIVTQDLPGSAITDPTHVSFQVSVPAVTPVQNYFYVRIGCKIAGVEDLIFSPMVKIQF